MEPGDVPSGKGDGVGVPSPGVGVPFPVRLGVGKVPVLAGSVTHDEEKQSGTKIPQWQQILWAATIQHQSPTCLHSDPERRES